MAEGFEQWQSTVTIEVQIAVRAARSEHVEPDEVAAGTAELLRAALKDSWGDDIRWPRFARLRLPRVTGPTGASLRRAPRRTRICGPLAVAEVGAHVMRDYEHTQSQDITPLGAS